MKTEFLAAGTSTFFPQFRSDSWPAVRHHSVTRCSHVDMEGNHFMTPIIDPRYRTLGVYVMCPLSPLFYCYLLHSLPFLLPFFGLTGFFFFTHLNFLLLGRRSYHFKITTEPHRHFDNSYILLFVPDAPRSMAPTPNSRAISWPDNSPECLGRLHCVYGLWFCVVSLNIKVLLLLLLLLVSELPRYPTFGMPMFLYYCLPSTEGVAA